MRGLLTLVLLSLVAGCLGAGAAPPAMHAAPDAGTPALAFGAPVALPGAFRAGEPSILAAPGLELVAAPSLSDKSPSDPHAAGHLWSSRDGGASFALRDEGPLGLRGAQAPGGGDSDLARDGRGAIYYADLWEGAASLAVSTDNGTTWSGVPLGSPMAGIDRPWVTGLAAGGALVTAAQHGVGLWAGATRDGGLTWTRTLALPAPGAFVTSGKPARDPTDPRRMLVPLVRAPEGGGADAIALVTDDEGATFAAARLAPFAGDVAGIAVSGAIDEAGTMYVAWADAAVRLAWSTDHGATWSAPATIAPGGRMPSLVAGAPWHVALAWADAKGVRAAASEDARAGFVPWPGVEAQVGGGGNDFVGLALGADGRLHLAYADEAKWGQPGALVLLRQSGGPSIL